MSKKSISYGLVAAGFLLFSQSGLSIISDTQPNDKKQFMVMEGIKDQKKDLTEYDFKKLSENIKKVADDCVKAATVTDDTIFLKERDNCAISIQQASGAIRTLDTKLEKIRSDVDAIGYLKLVSDDAPNVVAPKSQSPSTPPTSAVNNSNATQVGDSSNGAQNISVSNFPDQKPSGNASTDNQALNSAPPSEPSASSNSTGSSDGMMPPVSDPSLGATSGSSVPSDSSANLGGSAVGADPAANSTGSLPPSNP